MKPSAVETEGTRNTTFPQIECNTIGSGSTVPLPYVYAGPKQGYLGTGFSFDSICRMGIAENHPAIMRYAALKHWATLVFPERGTRPDWVREQLLRLAGHASRAAHMPKKQERGYNTRQGVREVAWLANRGAPWTGEPPPLPVVTVPRGRSKVAAMPSLPRSTARPALCWTQQAEHDLIVLQELGHKIPRSLCPTQTWNRPDPATLRPVLQPVPLPIAYHSWLSCSGRKENHNPCGYCRKHGRHRSTRALSAGPLDLTRT